nr:uncharacterized protein LOC129274385 [Lytechinus pictus]
MYRCRRQFDKANHLKMMDMVSTLMQEIEMLSLQKKDLKQQVRCLTEENSHLRTSSGGLVKEVGQLQETEMLSLQNKDLEQQVKRLKDENSLLRTSPGGLVKEVGQLQETEMLSLQNKDLEQQVKRLKEENSLLQTSSEDRVKEVNVLYQNMKQAVDRVCYYQERFKELDLPQAEQGHIETEPMGAVDISDKSDANS